MASSRRTIPGVLVLATVTAVAVTTAGVGAASPRPARPALAASAGQRHLAYLTNAGALQEVTVATNGSVSGAKTLATKPYGVAGSPDGRWLAWNTAQSHPTLSVRNMAQGTTLTLHTGKRLVGFAGDRVIVNYNRTLRLVLKPKPHFVRIRHALNPVTGVPGHVVTTVYGTNSNSGQLRLTAFNGTVTRLHRYSDWGPPNYREIGSAWASPDGAHLLVERGNHQDFYGLGHSSLVDEFGLGAGYPRSQLGHYGSSSQVWRVATATFDGSAAQPWVAWEAPADTNHLNNIQADVASWQNGGWVKQQAGAITVAADVVGDLVVQPGAYKKGTGPDPYPTATATSDALFNAGAGGKTGAHQVTLTGVRGTQFWWVSG